MTLAWAQVGDLVLLQAWTSRRALHLKGGQAAGPAAPAHAGQHRKTGVRSAVLAWAQVDDLVLLHGVDEQTGVYLEAPWNLARVSAVVPRVPKWS